MSQGIHKYVRNLKHLMLDMKELIDEEDAPQTFSEYFYLDQQFHLALLESLGDPYFSSLQYSSMGFFNHVELHLTDAKLSRKEVYDCHQKILDAICAGDSSAAYEALLEHSELMFKAL